MTVLAAWAAAAVTAAVTFRRWDAETGQEVETWGVYLWAGVGWPITAPSAAACRRRRLRTLRSIR